MAVFIRNCRTGLLYGGYNRWVTEFNDAFNFEKARRAAWWINTVKLGDAEVVRRDGRGTRKISMPLSASAITPDTSQLDSGPRPT